MQITAWEQEKGPSCCELPPRDTWMSATPRNEFCLNCKQDLIRDCARLLAPTLGPPRSCSVDRYRLLAEKPGWREIWCGCFALARNSKVISM
jgi:hypothetical protein